MILLECNDCEGEAESTPRQTLSATPLEMWYRDGANEQPGMNDFLITGYGRPVDIPVLCVYLL